MTIKTEGSMIQAKARLESGTKVVACIRPEEVLLVRATCGVQDANRFKGKVVTVSPGMIYHRISLDCGGFSLVALMERRGYPELLLSEGDELMAVFDPTAVHVIRDENDRRVRLKSFGDLPIRVPL
ncbi:MAG: TOBE domain-containing protein [Candidatus Binatia bacterium]